MRRTALIVMLIGPVATFSCRQQDETARPPAALGASPVVVEEDDARDVALESPDVPDGNERAAMDVDSRSVDIDHTLVAICPDLELRAEAVVDLDPPRDDALEFGEVEQEIDALEQRANEDDAAERERWQALARCMNEGPLQTNNLAIVEYGPGPGDTAEMAVALARELETFGIDRQRLEIERVVESLAAQNARPRLVVRIAERDV